jgi:hypothetical protein
MTVSGFPNAVTGARKQEQQKLPVIVVIVGN